MEKKNSSERQRSNIGNFKTEGYANLSTPSAPICKTVSFNSILLEWGQDDPDDDKLYTVEWSYQKKIWNNVYIGYAKSEVLKPLQPNTVYYFRVKYNKYLGESKWSSITKVKTKKESETVLDLHEAIQNEDFNKVDNILKNDKDYRLEIDSPNHFNISPLMNAIQRNCFSVVHELINHGANVNYSDASGRNCLMTACFIGNMKVVKLLRKLGCQWTAEDHFGNTPLHYAVEGNSSEVVKWAIKDGADVDVSNRNGWTPLLKHALFGGSIEITKILIEKGSDIDHQDIYGNTALILATIRNHPHIARELIDNNCDWSLKNDYHRTAMEIAEGMERKEIAQFLNKFKYKLDKEMKKKMMKFEKKNKKEFHEFSDDTKVEAFFSDNLQLYKLPKMQSYKTLPNEEFERKKHSKETLKPVSSPSLTDSLQNLNLDDMIKSKLRKPKLAWV